MTREMLLRLSAVAAILGGGLRVLDAFLNNADTYAQQIAYFATDAMLIFALCGIYLSRSDRLGFVGLVGFVSAITGILMVRSFGQGAYLVGASVTLVGMVVLSIVQLARGAFPKSAPVLWIASLDRWRDWFASYHRQLGRHGGWHPIRPRIYRGGNKQL